MQCQFCFSSIASTTDQGRAIWETECTHWLVFDLDSWGPAISTLLRKANRSTQLDGKPAFTTGAVLSDSSDALQTIEDEAASRPQVYDCRDPIEFHSADGEASRCLYEASRRSSSLHAVAEWCE